MDDLQWIFQNKLILFQSAKQPMLLLKMLALNNGAYIMQLEYLMQG